jgi:hypothetical protein
MWFITLRQSVKRPVRPPKTRRRLARQWEFVPRLEILEDRTVPSTLTVLNVLDSGAGSLRDTIKAAKSGDTIVFAPSLNGQTMTLTSGELAINNNLDIEGPGASLLAVSGNDTYRVFDIGQSVTATIAGLTITHGQTNGSRLDGGGSGGGGILNAGTLNALNDFFSNNQSQTHGGAISNGPAAVLTVTNSTFLDNQVGAKNVADQVEGGAIYNSNTGSSATIIGSTFVGNQAIEGDGNLSNNNKEVGAIGGALHNGGTSILTVENSTFIANQVFGGNGGSADKNATTYGVGFALGGAIGNDQGGTLVLDGSTFKNNQALGGSNNTGNATGLGGPGVAWGGALSNEGPATVTNCSFAGNQAVGGDTNNGGGGAFSVGAGVGGAIANVNFRSLFTLTVSNSTFANNRAIGGTGNTAGTFIGASIGGALANFDSPFGGAAMAVVKASTFTGNQTLGGQGSSGRNGGDGLGGVLANFWGATLTVGGCTLSGNQATGGAGGSGANGGNGFGGGIYNDGQSTLTVTSNTVTGNSATGGAAGGGASAGQGIGGGVYFASGGVVCLDLYTVAHILGNTASTSNNDIFGVYTTC